MDEQRWTLVHIGSEQYVICEVKSRFPTVLQAITKIIDGAVPANQTLADIIRANNIRDRMGSLTKYLLK
jgi:hypothetical protein